MTEFNRALEHHQAGRLKEAESLYRKILAQQPDHAGALHLLGVIALQLRQHKRAVQLIKRAIDISPRVPEYHNNLGEALRADHHLDRAITAYENALALKPQFPDAHNNLGLALQAQGRLSEAIAAYRHAIVLEPGTETYFNLGNALKEQNNLEEAIAAYQQVIAIRPDFVGAYLNLGAVLNRQRKSAEAVDVFERALALHPRSAEAHYNLGIALAEQGRTSEAIDTYRRALAIKPQFPDAHVNLGIALREQGKLDEAIAHLKQALALKSDFAEAHLNLGNTLKEQGRLDDAVSQFEQTLVMAPELAEAHYNLGLVRAAQGRLAEAMNAYERALELKPDYAEAYNNIGVVLKVQGALAHAAAAYKQALALKPHFAEAHYNLGNALKAQHRLAQAITCYRQALALSPELAPAHVNLGLALHDHGELEQAMAALERAIEIDPDSDVAAANLLYLGYQTSAWGNLERLERTLDALTRDSIAAARKTGESPFLNVARSADPARNLEVARCWSDDTHCRMASLQVGITDKRRQSASSRITLGYLSNDFHDHATAHLMRSLFALHDRERFEVFAYSYGLDDGSHYRASIKQDVDRFIDIRELSYTEAARKINQDGVDILVDLKGHTKGNRLEICALRPTPVQVTYLGFPGSTGGDFVDYLITDAVVTPADQARYYSEQLVYLPHCYQVNDHTQSIATTELKRADFGLPEQGFVFCSFNQPYKIEPVMFAIWMKLLRSLPGSALWLLRRNAFSEYNLKREAQASGVALEALIFSDPVAKDQHLRRLQLADLVLDTRIYNGHTTTSDALWAGVPVVALQGDHFASRVSASILHALGLPELITHSLEDYEALAHRLAQHPDELAALERKIARHRTTQPLYDTPRFTRNLERAYEQMWALFQAGQRPRRIEVIDNGHTSA
ncbi:MAG: tetratricopeptide repeat protein [Acidiferrobacterales bacterium]